MTNVMRTKWIAFLLAFITVFCTVITTVQTPVIAHAQEGKTYSNVLDDLKKDSSFNPSNYPAKSNDYSLQIIQLAESVDKELFVYVYQPSGKTKNFKASSINISTTINDSISYLNYKLELLNSNGVFYKYNLSMQYSVIILSQVILLPQTLNKFLLHILRTRQGRCCKYER